MGIFGKTKEKPFISNGRLVEIVNENDAYTGYKALERQLERRYLYRNVESISPTGSSGIIIVKYKDLKVRSEIEVKLIKEQLIKEAGFDIER